MSFNENSAQVDVPQGGSEIPAVANPENPLIPGGEEHEVGASGGLPWYVANKFEIRRNKSGVGSHMAPQESFVQDVLIFGQKQAEMFLPEKEGKTNEELEFALREVELTRSLLEVRNDFDIDDDAAALIKMEAKDILRNLRDRYIMSLSICGSCHVDRMYSIRHAQLMDWDVNNTTNSKRFIDAGNTRDKWARKAAYYGFVISNLTTEFNNAGIDLNLEGGIRQRLYQDARNTKQWLDSSRAELPDATGQTAEAKAALDALAA